jgi:hypothetical protein
MLKVVSRPPRYCRQKEKGRPDRAYVLISGRRISLGRYGSPESYQQYAEAINEKPSAPAPAAGSVDADDHHADGGLSHLCRAHVWRRKSIRSNPLPAGVSYPAAHACRDVSQGFWPESVSVLVHCEMEFWLQGVSELKGVWLFSSC